MKFFEKISKTKTNWPKFRKKLPTPFFTENIYFFEMKNSVQKYMSFRRNTNNNNCLQ